MNKKDVIKHSAAIQISNKVSVLQRRAWNVLLANAFDDLEEKDTYQLSIKELAGILGFDSGNLQYLKELLKELNVIQVEWNILRKDYREWGVFTLLSQAVIINGQLIYSFAPILRERLHNPSMYARINLSLQNSFKYKHTLPLFEILVDYFNIKSGYSETPWIPLEKFRELMGVEDNEYPEFKKLNQYVIKQSIQEINKSTIIYIDEGTGVLKERENKKVIALKFIIQKNRQTISVDEALEKEQCSEQLCLPLPDFEIENQELLNILVTEFGIPDKLSIQILKNRDEYMVNQTLDEIRKKVKLSDNLLSKSDLALKAFFPQIQQQKSKSFSPSPSKSKVKIDAIEKRLRLIGFHTFKKVRKQHSDQVLMDAFKELDFEIAKRQKTGESIDNLGGWLRMRLPEPGQPYQFSSLYKKHLEKEAAKKKAQEIKEKEERVRVELIKKQEEQRKAFNEKIDIKIAELKQNPDEWEALEKEALANAKLKVSAPAQKKEIKQLAEARLKNLGLDDLKEIEIEAVQFAESVLKDCKIDRNSPAFKTTVENHKLEIVKTKYLEEFNQELSSTPAYIYYQHNLSKQVAFEIRNLVSHKYFI
ncbi:MAG: RepB family plasmid replication initiator protein [Desulfamplus sp.]